MWLIFLISSIACALATVGLIWIINKVIISMKRDNRKFEQEDISEEKKE